MTRRELFALAAAVPVAAKAAPRALELKAREAKTWDSGELDFVRMEFDVEVSEDTVIEIEPVVTQTTPVLVVGPAGLGVFNRGKHTYSALVPRSTTVDNQVSVRIRARGSRLFKVYRAEVVENLTLPFTSDLR